MLIAVIALAVLVAGLLFWLVTERTRRMRDSFEHETYRKEHPYSESDLRESRSTALKLSRSVVTGHAAEHLTPLIPEFLAEFNPRDWQWVGQPIDFLIWDGLEDGHLKRVVLLEVKSGRNVRNGGGLNKRQREIRLQMDWGAVDLEWRLVDISDPTDPRIVETALARQKRRLQRTVNEDAAGSDETP